MTALRRVVLFLATAALLAGCVTFDNPDAYRSDSSAGAGVVCVYRTAPRSTPGAWQTWVIDGRWSGEIRPDRYDCLEIPAGRHVVRVGAGSEKLEFALQGDERIFIRFEVEEGVFGRGIYPVRVDPETARAEFEKRGADVQQLRIHRAAAAH